MKNETKFYDRSTNSSRSVNNSCKSFRNIPSGSLIKDEKIDNWSLPVNLDEQLNSIKMKKKINIMLEYRFSKVCIQHQKLEKIQDFILYKKSKNPLKYNGQCKMNLTALPVPRGTISIMLNSTNKDYGFNLSNLKKQIPPKSKFKMKWKAIQWLLDHKREAIDQLCNNYSIILKITQEKNRELTRNEFGDLLGSVGLGGDVGLADKLFYIFDDDKSGTVDYKELIMGLEVFKENSIEEKLKVFFDLCKTDSSGKIPESELYNILKRNMTTEQEKIKLRITVREIFKNSDLNGDGFLDKEELYEGACQNTVLRNLLEESVNNVKKVDKLIENDLQEPFQCWIPVSADFVNYKEGIHFPLVKKLFRVIKDNEELHYKHNMRKKTYQEILKPRKDKRDLNVDEFEDF